MHIKNKRAFSFVEIIITISIIALLAVIGISSKQGYDENMNNTKVVSDIETINNALESYFQENARLPLPGGNTNFFKIDTTYSHSYEDEETFGVYGALTDNTIAKKYLDLLPLDPRTNSYYSYGKTKLSNQFEIASVQILEGVAIAKVSGNYTAEAGPYNLIREYNGSNFVTNNSKTNLPYNPEELIMIVTDGNGTIYREGDTISANESDLELFFSDGSVSILTKDSQITLNSLDFPKGDNLNTIVKLALSAGTIWTKATHLNDESKFEVYTTDSVAAVRGTIFGVTKNTATNTTETIVIEGVVNVYDSEVEVTNERTILDKTLELNIQNYDDANKVEIVVKKDETPKKVEVSNEQSEYETTETSEITDDEEIQEIIDNIDSFTPADSVRDDDTVTKVTEEGELAIIGEIFSEKIDDMELVFYDGFDIDTEDNTETSDSNQLPAFKGFGGFRRHHESDDIEQGDKFDVSGFLIENNGYLNAKSGNGNFLKYEGLELGDEFAIEMRVSTETLTTVGNRYFFDGGTGEGLQIDYTTLYIFINGIPVCQNGAGINCVPTNLTGDFTVIKLINGVSLQIGNNTPIPLDDTYKISGVDDLYVGSSSAPSLPINGLIDYVKIYKD